MTRAQTSLYSCARSLVGSGFLHNQFAHGSRFLLRGASDCLIFRGKGSAGSGHLSCQLASVFGALAARRVRKIAMAPMPSLAGLVGIDDEKAVETACTLSPKFVRG